MLDIPISEELKNKETCFELFNAMLNIKPVLSPLIFDTDETMYTEVRKGLLKVAYNITYYANEILNNVVVEDICLVAGMAGYIYHEKSDIDIFIIITPNEEMIDKTEFEKRYKYIGTSFHGRGMNFCYKNHFVDSSLVSNPRIAGGCYSLIYNQWIKKPQKLLFNFTPEELYQECLSLDRQINSFMLSLPKKGAQQILSYTDCQRAEKFMDTFKENMLNLKAQQGEYNKTYVAYRALKKLGIIQKLFKYTKDCIAILWNDGEKLW